jgi:hypothetical protein
LNTSRSAKSKQERLTTGKKGSKLKQMKGLGVEGEGRIGCRQPQLQEGNGVSTKPKVDLSKCTIDVRETGVGLSPNFDACMVQVFDAPRSVKGILTHIEAEGAE